MAVNDIYLVKYYHQKNTQLGLVTRYYRVSFVLGAGATDLECRDLLISGYKDLWKVIGSDSAKVIGITTQRVYPLPVQDFVSKTVAEPGQVAGDPLPNATSLLITLRSGEAGRRKRGRAYIPFLAEADNTTGTGPTSGLITAAQSLAAFLSTGQTLVGAAGATTMIPCLFNRSTNAHVDLTSYRVRDYWGNQRRRASVWSPDNTVVPAA